MNRDVARALMTRGARGPASPNRARPAIALLLVLAITLLGRVASAASVLPPGQESAVEALLQLPDGHACRYESASIVSDRIEATYTCRGTSVLATLGHLSSALTDSVAVDQWRVATASSELRSALTARVTERGASVRWTDPASEAGPQAAPFVLTQLADGALEVLLVLTSLLAMVLYTLHGAPRRVWWWLWVAVGAGVALRIAWSPWAAFGVWPYLRVQLLAHHLWSSRTFAAMQATVGHDLALVDLNHSVTFASAVLTPLAVFAHGTLLFRSRTTGLLAAWMVALNPSHIRLSWSDSEMVSSLLLATSTVGLLHLGQAAPRAPARAFALAAFGPVLVLALLTREANLAIAPVAVGALLLQAHSERRLERWVGLVVCLVAVAVYLRFTLMPRLELEPRPEVWGGLPDLVQRLLSPNSFILWNPRITPPVYWLMLPLGLWALAKRPRLGVYLSMWFAGYGLLHLLIGGTTPEMNARYQLHLLSPLVLLCAAGARAALSQRSRWTRAVVAVGALSLLPIGQLAFVRNTDADDLSEYTTVRAWSQALPDGCTVVEHITANDTSSRMWRMAAVMRDGEPTRRLNVLLHADRGVSPPVLEGTAPGLLQAGAPLPRGGCVVAYLGLPCYTSTTAAAPMERSCQELLSDEPLRTLSSRPLSGRAYDDHQQVPRDDKPRSLLLVDHSTPGRTGLARRIDDLHAL